MTQSYPTLFLRRVLLVDAAISGATGLLSVAGAGLMQSLLAVPSAVLTCAGLSLVAFAVLVAYVATRATMPRAGVIAVIVCNLVWAADSILVLLGGWIAPSPLGYAFITAQALVVAILAQLEYVGLRRSIAAPA
jgi:hypothetical protein